MVWQSQSKMSVSCRSVWALLQLCRGCVGSSSAQGHLIALRRKMMCLGWCPFVWEICTWPKTLEHYPFAPNKLCGRGLYRATRWARGNISPLHFCASINTLFRITATRLGMLQNTSFPQKWCSVEVRGVRVDCNAFRSRNLPCWVQSSSPFPFNGYDTVILMHLVFWRHAIFA